MSAGPVASEIAETSIHVEFTLTRPVAFVDGDGVTYQATAASYWLRLTPATLGRPGRGRELLDLRGYRMRRDGAPGRRLVSIPDHITHPELWGLADSLVAQARAALHVDPATITQAFDRRRRPAVTP